MVVQRAPQWREQTAYWRRDAMDSDRTRENGYDNGYVLPGTKVASYDPNGRNHIQMPGSLHGMDTSSNMDGQWLDASIWWRMAVIIRMRRIDLIEIMHSFDPKDANIFEQTVFQRALADCFGNQWSALGMTAQEYDEIIKDYLAREPTGPGQPPAMISYRRFAYDLMKLAEDQLDETDMQMAMAMRGKATKMPLAQKGGR